MTREQIFESVLNLLQQLIATPSFSKEEENTAVILEEFFKKSGIKTQRILNNV